jgi:multisubunit Na+/H+ antiporter MnhG subunit
MTQFIIGGGILMVILGIFGLNLKDSDYTQYEKCHNQKESDRTVSIVLLMLGIVVITCGIFMIINPPPHPFF